MSRPNPIPIQKRVGFLCLHCVLVAGSFVFAIPFFWLLSTSAKVPEEMYPPRWLPQIPWGVAQSPYMDIFAHERAEKPELVAAVDWERLKGPLLEAISRKAAAIPGLPGFYAPYLDRPEIAEAVFKRILRRTPEGIFSQTPEFASAWFAERTTPALVGEAFESVYRRAAIAGLVFKGHDLTRIETPMPRGDHAWRVVYGDAELVERDAGLLRQAQEIHYALPEGQTLVLETIQPLNMGFDQLKKFDVSLHGDRSWLDVRASIEFAGQHWRAAQPAYLSTDTWLDYTWQFAGPDDDSLKIKTWYRLDPAGASSFDEPHKARVRLTFKRRSPWATAWSKLIDNYRDVLRIVPMWTYIGNSVLLVVLNIAGQIIGSSLVAFAFARLRWPGREFCFVLVLATLMIPPQVTMIPVFLIFKNLGWYNTLLPLWVPSVFGSAFYIFLLRQFMRSIPSDLEDSAKIDGCGYLGIYVRIILPLIKPALATIGIFTFMAVWNEFMGPLIYLSDQELYPLSLGLFALQVFQNLNFGLMMAASVLMTVPVIVLFFLAQRQFIQGITLTGLKG